MSRSNRTCQTETALNVSQDYETPVRSSSPASATVAVVEKGDCVLVEDSLGVKGKVPAADGEVVEDSVENGNVKAKRAQTKRPVQEVEDGYDELYSLTPERPRGKAVQKPAKVSQPAEAPRMGNMNAIDALLTRGATVHKSKHNPSELEQAPAEIRDTDEVARSQRGTSAGKPSMPAKKVPTKAQNSSNATGSLAALRMRRGQDPAGTGSTPTQSAMGNVLQPRDANAQTPAIVSKPASSGKLKSIKGGMFARTPVTAAVNGAQKAASGKPQSKATGKSSDEQRSIAAAPAQNPTVELAANTSTAKSAAGSAAMKTKEATKSAPQSTQKIGEKQKALKRSVNDMKTAGDVDHSMYDVPHSEGEGERDSDQNEYRPTKKARKGEAPQTKRMAAKSSTVGSPAPVKKTTRNSKGKAAKLSAEYEPTSATPGTSTRARMKAVSGVTALLSKPKMNAKPAKQLADGQEDRDPSDRDTMDGDAPGACPVPNVRPPNQRPETPVVILSSPPVDGRTSIRPTTAGVVDTASARKPTVIAFDKSGPRNQGTSAQRNRGRSRDEPAVPTDVDGFANVDDFGGDTILVDAWDAAPQAVDPAQSARTVSQRQMPPPESKEKPRIVNVAPVVPSMVQSEAQNSGSGSNALIKGDNSQRPLKRQKSQGTVDIHGSPVPEGMVVGGLNTVLETFSQQAGLSSDKFVGDGQNKNKVAGKTSSERSSTKPHRAPARLSSNTKPVPAEPSQESQAVTHVARVLKGGQFVQRHIAQSPSDPFTSSAEERKRKGKGSSSSTFSEHLRQQVAHVTEAAQTMQAQQQDEQEEYEAMEDEEGEDPEKTLVEENEEVLPSPAHRHSMAKSKSKTQRLASSSSDSSTSSTSSTDDPSYKDLGKWRLALKPHQLSLFDSLVTVAHRLTAHLASREEAERNIVDDYRRRGKNLVQSLKAGRGKDVGNFVRAFGERKRALGREMERESGRVARKVEEVRSVRKSIKERVKMRDAGKGERNVDGEGLREIVEGYC